MTWVPDIHVHDFLLFHYLRATQVICTQSMETGCNICEFSYLDYSFDVLISWVRQLSSFNWFYHITYNTLLDASLHDHVCFHEMFFNTWFWVSFIDTQVFSYACHLVSFHHSLGSFMRTCMSKLLELGLKWTRLPMIKLILWSKLTSCPPPCPVPPDEFMGFLQ